MQTVLVTGNCGYVGSVLGPMLRERGHEVVGLDCGLYVGCEFEPASPVDRQIWKDIRDLTADDLFGVDAIVHLAGLSNDPLGELSPSLTQEINVDSSITLALLAKAAGIQKFVFASSCSVYGLSSLDTPIDEDGDVNPLTEYAKSKLFVERAVGRLADKSFHPVFLRNATVYGRSPRLRLDLVVNNLVAAAYATGRVTVLSDGTPWRPLLHVEDMASAFIAALEAPGEQVHNKTLNVGRNDGNYRVKEIAERVCAAVPGSLVEIAASATADERSYRVDFSRVDRELPGFSARWDLDKGIEQLCAGFRERPVSDNDLRGPSYFRVRWIRQLIGSNALDSSLRWLSSPAIVGEPIP